MYRQKAFCTAPIRAATLLSSLVALLLLSPSSLHAQDAPGTYAGVLSFVWGDQVVDGQVRASTVSARLLTEAGEAIPLEITQELLSAGSMAALQGEQVVVHGQVSAAGTIEVESLAPTAGVDAASASARPPVYGSHPWLVLLCHGCRRCGHPRESPSLLRRDDGHLTLCSRPLLARALLRQGQCRWAAAAPAGSTCRSRQRPTKTGRTTTGACLRDKAAADCTTAADPTVDFTPYDGIVLIVPLPPVDGSAATWFYGGLTYAEAGRPEPCHSHVWMPMEIADANTTGGTDAAHHSARDGARLWPAALFGALR